MVGSVDAVFQSYYTKSEPIVRYMTQMLDAEHGHRILDPCGGDGVFADAIKSAGTAAEIDIYEIDPAAIAVLTEKFAGDRHVRIHVQDALTSEELSLIADHGGAYDRIIANPPYGGWQDHSRRRALKNLFPGLYVKETYSLFLLRSLRLLRDGGRLVFIVPDTFLNLHRHTQLRKILLTGAAIEEIALFPSRFFPEVGFGYSDLSVITLKRCRSQQESLSNSVRVVSGYRSVAELGRSLPHHRTTSVTQREIFGAPDHALLISSNASVPTLIRSAATTISDVADCVTGFYSGNDKEHVRSSSTNPKARKGYKQVSPENVCDAPHAQPDILLGLTGSRYFVPLVKGGGTKYHKPDHWYVDWSVDAVRGYLTSRKARFQNSQFYFRQGIGVPMVSSRQITAALLDYRIFDQSIVGVFPKEKTLLLYLLAFFNSPTCNTLIRTINPSANNSANYLKKIPFIRPSERVLQQVDQLVAKLLHDRNAAGPVPEAAEQSLHQLIASTYGF